MFYTRPLQNIKWWTLYYHQWLYGAPCGGT